MTSGRTILTEDETIDRALAGASLARFGDGELRLCVHLPASAQRPSSPLAAELRAILRAPGAALVCLPRAVPNSPKFKTWLSYSQPKYSTLIPQRGVYGSSLVTRPDSAPWIDRPDYWEKVRSLWRDRDVVLCSGPRSTALSPLHVVRHARSVWHVAAPETDAYRVIDDLEAEIMEHHERVRMAARVAPVVLISAGPTATVLAHRLAERGAHAVDVGHVAMFMRRSGEL